MADNKFLEELRKMNECRAMGSKEGQSEEEFQRELDGHAERMRQLSRERLENLPPERRDLVEKIVAKFEASWASFQADGQVH